ncbi:MAG: RNA polymerase sigma factor RpoD [Bacteroidia bacterium]|jgi:RNA polymerase primary sigma factor|nr:MAG: RNA polymerase sigma factor RpoD [Bacteroidia bacterium]
MGMRQLKIQKQITNRESQSLDKYLQEIGKVPLLSMDEEAELARRIRQGDEEALEKLVKANLRFVVSVAKQYQNQGLPLTDLISEGNLGLIKAAKRFDETRGFKFISYAVWWIRQSILQALAEQSRIVRLPLNRVGALNKINKVFARLEQEYEREPSPEEIAEAMNGTLSPEEIAEIMRQSGRHVSLDSPIAPGEDTRFIDVLENTDLPQPDQVLMYESLRQEISKALATLEEREAQILRMHFGIDQRYPMTMEEIAEKLGLTRERVRQIKEKAIRKLRSNPTVLEPLRQYLG